MVKTEKQIKMIRISGKILANAVSALKEKIAEGRSLKELDRIAKQLIMMAGAEPTFLGYHPYGAKKPYPASICASVNEVVVHGLPGEYKLKSGDILSVDLGSTYRGFIADAAFTVGIGEISKQAKDLIDATRQALIAGIEECQEGKTLGDIGWAINNAVISSGFKVVKGLSGHGVGLELHEDPPVFNEGEKSAGLELKAGMVLALEPMVSAGDPHIIQQPDDSYVTRDRSLAAHFEHTVLITKKGAEILTV